MFSETLYNVIIAPHIEDKLLKKRSNFTKWLWSGIIFLIFSMCYSIYDFIYKSNEFSWVNTVLSIGGMAYIIWAIFTIFYNPLRKYHISLQIYLYILFLDYFYYINKKYPNGFAKKMQYVVIVQSCIDSIDKYIRMMETLLISGENTKERIEYLYLLRKVFYKMKGEEFFRKQITSFRNILDNFYSSTHIGLKAVLDFKGDIEFFDNNNLKIRIDECNCVLKLSESDKLNNKEHKDEYLPVRKYSSIIILLIILLILIVFSIKLPEQLWTKASVIVTALVGLIDFYKFFKNDK